MNNTQAAILEAIREIGFALHDLSEMETSEDSFSADQHRQGVLAALEQAEFHLMWAREALPEKAA